MVSADDAGILTVDRVLVDSLRWEVVTVDASEVGTLQEVIRLVGRAFERLLAATPEHLFLSVRVCIQGRTGAHGELFGLESQLREEILGQAAGQGSDRLWVEKVRLETQPLIDGGALALRTDALADLQRLLEQAPTDPDFLQSLLDDLRPMVDKAPLELIRRLPELEAIRLGQAGELVRSVSPGLLAYLAQAN